MKHLTFILTLIAMLAVAAAADNAVGFQASDTTATVLKRQVGQRIELRMKSGEKLGGKIEAVGDKTVHLTSVTGQELFDAVVVIDDIAAVLIRTSGK